MNDKPPLLPVLVGVGSIGIGLFNGLFFGVWASIVLLGRREEDPPVASLASGLLLLLGAFALLQVTAGIGILLHRPWGKQLAQGMAFGTTVASLLGMGPGFLGLGGFPDVVMATFLWGFATELTWAIALNVACRFRSMKVAFGEAVARDVPPASVG